MRTYPVLARVSPGYSEPKGTFPRVTHPSAADVLLRPLDLHVLSLPPAFALSQDQTLKLDLKLLNRLITTFDEVPPYLSPAIHIADDDGVTFKTCTAEVFRPASTTQKPKFSSIRDSQGLRRPRFSFFIFTCQTARVRRPNFLFRKLREAPIRRQITTDDHRLLIHSS